MIPNESGEKLHWPLTHSPPKILKPEGYGPKSDAKKKGTIKNDGLLSLYSL